MAIIENRDSTTEAAPNLLRASCALGVISLFLIGLGYSLVATGIGQLLFPTAANGSLIERDGAVVGSVWVAQPFVSDRYFHSRPSAVGYDPMAVSGSNQARTNPDLRSRVNDEKAAVALRETVKPEEIPSDMITQSGSGSDPDISPRAARIQIDRVARARGISTESLAKLVQTHTQGPQWRVFGQSRVNVLALNVALDALEHQPQAH